MMGVFWKLVKEFKTRSLGLQADSLPPEPPTDLRRLELPRETVQKGENWHQSCILSACK